MDSSCPIGDGGGEADAREEVAGSLIVAGGDAAPILQSVEGALDDVAVLVSDGIERARIAGACLGRNDRLTALQGEEIVHVGSTIGFVTDQPSRGQHQSQEGAGTNNIVHVAGGQQHRVEPTDGIAERVDFGGPPAARAADRLILLPPFAPAAERCARTVVLSTIASSGS